MITIKRFIRWVKKVISKIPKRITLRKYWYRNIYLKSPGWKMTRDRILKRDNNHCKKCSNGWPLHVHHEDYRGTPKMRWWHFIPFIGQFFIWSIDTRSKLKTLCAKHHSLAHGYG